MLCCAVLLQALSWTFYLLLQHPEVEQKLLAEIQQVLGPQQQPAGSKDSSKAAADAAGADGSGSPGVLRPSYDQLRQLRYARAVFMEALRLYPSVPEVSGVGGGRLRDTAVGGASSWVCSPLPRVR